MRTRLWLCGYLLLLCSLPVGLHAQTVRGKLLDAETEQPIASATVVLLGLEGQNVVGVVTDAGGAFVLEAPRTGRYQLRGERIGYQTALSSPLDVFRGDTVTVELRLSTEAVLLAPLTVTVSPRPNMRNRALDGFYERQRRGRGRFFSPGDIERLRPAYATTLLQMTPGVRVQYPRVAGQRPLPVLRSGIRECVPTLYVDGNRAPLDAEISLDDWVSGGSLRALEIYRSAAEIPAEFQSFNNCGAIVAWTEYGLGLVRYDQMQSTSRRLLVAAIVGATLTALTLLIAGR